MCDKMKKKRNRLLAYYDWLWERNFSALKAFKQKYGHCRVTRRKNPNLARWVFKQRFRTMDITRRKKLERIGFIFDYFEEHWQNMFAKLEKYKAKYGHCDVPEMSPDDGVLGKWVAKQRSPGYGRRIKPHRKKLLTSIGFNFKHPSSPEFVFKRRIKELKEFKRLHGHFRITHSNEISAFLSDWVYNLRYRRNRLPKYQIQALDKINFDWRTDIRKNKPGG